jgi:dTDP-4-dehydrorhamnose 3,5-epimerase
MEGVRIKNLVENSDFRGSFTEILRDTDGLLEKICQVSISKTAPNIIKAFHCHEKQDDVFYVMKGKINLVLHNPTQNKTESMILHEDSNKIVLIPRGIYHGYQVLGGKSAEVLYMMSNTYNPKKPDELRIDFNDKKINYKWNTYQDAVLFT